MKRKHLGGWWMALLLIIVGSLDGRSADESSQSSATQAISEPMMLDLSPFFWERFVTPERTNTEMVSVSGRQIFDGLPFQVDGRACLYGKAGTRKKITPPFEMTGIKVGRTFDELHLLHATQFTDREQEVVAKARLNYTDGTRYEFPLAYGVHVRDWQRMHSEEKEIYTDPDTKVIWRGPGVDLYKSTTRMSKTKLINPFPQKTVETIDFISARNIAWYDIAAATVANRDPSRPVTPPVLQDRPDRVFDTSLIVRLVDVAGEPIPGVMVEPNIQVAGSWAATVATPFYTDTNGMGRVKYPKADSASMYFVTMKDGWKRAAEDPWVRLTREQDKVGTNQIIVTIRMLRDAAGVPGTLTQGNSGTGKPGSSIAPGTGSATTSTGSVGNGGSAPTSVTSPDFRPHPVLVIHFPVGSKVRVEATDNLGVKVWDSVTTITNLPASPYPYICGEDCPTASQRYYRAVLVP